VERDETEMKTVCSYCEKSASHKFNAKDVNRNTSSHRFNYYQCSSCDLIFLSPIPNNLGDFYPEEYYQLPSDLETLARDSSGERYKVDLIQQFISQGRLLEIGPATGAFAYQAKAAGFQVETIEMDSRCCTFLREVIEIPTIQSDDVSSALQGMGSFDVIALWHVIEHLPYFWLDLKTIADHVAPGGLLVLAAPNPDALQFQVFKRFWTHLDTPRHVTLIPMKLLQQFLESQGFTCCLMTTSDEGGLNWNRFGWIHSLANFSTHKVMKRGLSFCGRILNKIFKRIESQEHLGATYTMILKKGQAS
jgi:2-polyprenyl-3-methyl-5-hydroxy-6-metoxy-1,4-benzoquinol methylase